MSCQQVLPVIAPLSAVLQLTPVAPVAQPPVVVPPSQSCCNPVTPVVQAPTTYPPPKAPVKRVSASYHQEPVPELLKNWSNEWTLCLPIPIPSDLINPTLTSLVYYLKYGSTHDSGNSTVQTDIVLTTKSCPSGIVLNPKDLVVYRDAAAGFGLRMVDEDAAVRLLSVPSVKCNGGTAQWCHYIDHHHIAPNVHVVEASNLYLAFHVSEYPTAQTLRSLAVEISATWLDDVAERKRRQDEEEEKKKKAQEAEQAAAAAAAAAKAKPTVEAAPKQADPHMQQNIADAIKKFNLEPCPNGYAWNKVENGYQCAGKGHFVSFEQLGMK